MAKTRAKHPFNSRSLASTTATGTGQVVFASLDFASLYDPKKSLTSRNIPTLTVIPSIISSSQVQNRKDSLT
jgi:hypothetical protein